VIANELDYDRLGAVIARELLQGPKDEDILWTSYECAKYLGMSHRHFRDRVSKRRGFPQACAIGKTWLRADVVRWAKNN